jgi:hypothetical protein
MSFKVGGDQFSSTLAFYDPVGTPIQQAITTSANNQGQENAISQHFASMTPADLVQKQSPVQNTAPASTAKNNLNTVQQPKKKKGGFFRKIGRAFKKFAKSKIGKIVMIAGAVAGAAFIPGVGAAMLKGVMTIGKSVLGAGKFIAGAAKSGLMKLGTKLDMENMLKGGFKNFIQQNLLPKFGLDKGFPNFIKQQFFSKAAFQDFGKNLFPDMVQRLLQPTQPPTTKDT